MKKRGIRSQFTILANFYQSSDPEQKLEEKNFNSSCTVMVNTTEVKEQIDSFGGDLMNQFAEFQGNQSGWIFHSVKFLAIFINTEHCGGTHTSNCLNIFRTKKQSKCEE